MALTGLGVGQRAVEGDGGKHGPYANVPSSQMGNPSKHGERGSFPLNTPGRAKAAESYIRYLPPSKRSAMMSKIHRLYPQLPGAKS